MIFYPTCYTFQGAIVEQWMNVFSYRVRGSTPSMHCWVVKIYLPISSISSAVRKNREEICTFRIVSETCNCDSVKLVPPLGCVPTVADKSGVKFTNRKACQLRRVLNKNLNLLLHYAILLMVTLLRFSGNCNYRNSIQQRKIRVNLQCNICDVLQVSFRYLFKKNISS